jgi:glycerol dehydrogenase
VRVSALSISFGTGSNNNFMEGNLRAFCSPHKYIQGPDSILLLNELLPDYGGNALIVIDPFLYDEITAKIKPPLERSGIKYEFAQFGGKVSDTEIDRLVKIAANNKCTVIAGIGGGKTIDTVKAVSDETGAYTVVVPTTASTDAPCSSLSIVYNTTLSEREVRKCKRNPDLVLVDSAVIMNAPVRYFIAGIGDALATYPEARAAMLAGGKNFIGDSYRSARLALSISKECWTIIIDQAVDAYNDILNKKCTDSVEDVIEANILLSGIGFENAGCAGAHSISKGISALDKEGRLLHGEKVAFGTLCQLVLEKRYDELKKLQSIYKAIGLPISLKELELSEPLEENISIIASESMKNAFWGNEPFIVDECAIKKILEETNDLGGKCF